jgi:hypothetical protein
MALTSGPKSAGDCRVAARPPFTLPLALAAGGFGCGPDTVTLPTPPMQAETAALVRFLRARFGRGEAWKE